MPTKTNQPTNASNETKADFTIRLPPDLTARIARLVEYPELGFESPRGFIIAAVYSFASYQESRLKSFKGGGR